MSDEQRPVSPDGQWEWDGTAWVPRTQLHQPPTPPGFFGPEQLGAQPPSKPGTSKGKKVLAWVGGAFALMIVFGMVGGGSDKTDPSETSASTLAKVAEDGSGGSDDNEGVMPADQAAWLSAVGEGQKAAEDANELQIVQARKERGRAMCEALGDDLTVSNWVGEVDTIETTVGGDGGVLDLLVAADVKVGTWNNGLSDIGTGSIIDPDSRLWTQIIDLEEGDKLYFSGRFDGDADDCITESSLMDENGMLTPSFIFKFTGASLVSNGPLSTASKTDDSAVTEGATVADEGDTEPTKEAKPTKTAKPKPQLTSGQENAIRSAKDYLDYSAFSRKGLIEQLGFEGYPAKDAAFAADHLKVNWNEQAVKAARDYLDYSGFSRQGLVEQLVFEGYTQEQAAYGADKALR